METKNLKRSFEKAILTDINIDDYVDYQLSFIPSKEIFDKLVKEIPFEQQMINVFGLKKEPRLTAVFGKDTSMKYTYSKSTRTLLPISKYPTLNEIFQQVEKKLEVQFDFVLANYYQDGKHYVNWHSDNEKCIDQTFPIASVSFGSERTFVIRDKKTHEIVFKKDLENGSLLVMKPGCQDLFQHTIPKSKSKEGRINLTFRKFIVPH